MVLWKCKNFDNVINTSQNVVHGLNVLRLQLFEFVKKKVGGKCKYIKYYLIWGLFVENLGILGMVVCSASVRLE